MRSIIVEAGPTGLYTAVALARRGHQVTVIDRDPGPADSQSWDRKGVMQFHHPHFFRQQVVDALVAEMPEVCQGLLAAGATPAVLPGQPSVPAELHCRRLTFERVLREAAQAEPGVWLRTGHVDGVCAERGRVAGVRAGGGLVDADLVIDAGGRAGRLTRDELASLVTTAASSRSYPGEDTATPPHGSEHATARCPRNTRVTCLAARAQLPMSEPSSRSAAYATSRAWASPP